MSELETLAALFPYGRSLTLTLIENGVRSRSVPGKALPLSSECREDDFGLYVFSRLRVYLLPEAELNCGDTVTLGAGSVPLWRVLRLERFPHYAVCLLEERPAC